MNDDLIGPDGNQNPDWSWIAFSCFVAGFIFAMIINALND